MAQDTTALDVREDTLAALLRALMRGPLVVATDSCVATALLLEVPNRLMSSVLHEAQRTGLIVRTRNPEARDYYDNPVTFTITHKGRTRAAEFNAD